MCKKNHSKTIAYNEKDHSLSSATILPASPLGRDSPVTASRDKADDIFILAKCCLKVTVAQNCKTLQILMGFDRILHNHTVAIFQWLDKEKLEISMLPVPYITSLIYSLRNWKIKRSNSLFFQEERKENRYLFHLYKFRSSKNRGPV